MPVLRLIQISDCHISEDPDALYHGQHSLKGLTKVLEAAAAFGPDAIIASGDLSDDGSPGSYQTIYQALRGLGVPVFCLPGNHDVRKRMEEVFAKPPFAMPAGWTCGCWRLHFLDSNIPGEISGDFTARSQAQLLTALAAQAEPFAMLFLHHQPLPVGSAWIDRYPLIQANLLQNLINDEPKIRAVAWGHIHHAWQKKTRRVVWLGCPSTTANSLAFEKQFELDPAGPACRWLKLGIRGRIETGILRPYPGGSISHKTI